MLRYVLTFWTHGNNSPSSVCCLGHSRVSTVRPSIELGPGSFTFHSLRIPHIGPDPQFKEPTLSLRPTHAGRIESNEIFVSSVCEPQLP